MRSLCVTAFGAPLQVIEKENPEPQGAEVLVRVTHCGVCHSDIHLHDGYYELGGGKRLSLTDRGITPPVTLGHEIVGKPVAFGPDAARLDGEQHHVVFPWLGCRTCRACRAGEEQLCPTPRSLGVYNPGGYADHVLVAHSDYLVPLGALDPAGAAPLACSGVTAFGAAKRAGTGLGSDDVIVVMGAGGVGLMAVILLRALGHTNVVVADPSAERRAAAKERGAVFGLDPAAPDALARLAEHAKPDGVGAVADFVGNEETSGFALAALRRGGRYVIVGLFGGELRIALPTIPMRALSILGSYTGSLGELRALVALAQDGELPFLPVQTRPLAEADQALNELRAGRVTGRTVLVA
jgi:D-arabinose 1-dehydrogenase-like Zn-dependent alcohol dehydrogenase